MAKRRSNPDLDTTDFTEKALPGFGAYVATRFASRAAFSIAEKRAPKVSRHIAIATGLAALGAAWAFGKRVKQTERFYEPILVGAGIAAAQGIIQGYLPKYSWVMGDLPAPATTRPPATMEGPSLQELMGDDSLEEVPLLGPGSALGSTTEDVTNNDDLFAEMGTYDEVNDI